MHAICFNPDVSLICRPPLSLSFNHPCYLFDEMLERNPLLIPSPKCCGTYSCSCCYYGANSLYCNDRLAAINPSFLCKGLRQSTLIQWSLCKRLIFHGSSKRVYHITSGGSSFTDLDRDYYYKNIFSLNERRKQRQRGLGGKRKKQFLSNVSDDYAGDVEVMLSLLTDEVGLECIDVRDRKKIDKKHIVCDDKENKIVGSGAAKRDVKCDKIVKVHSTKVDISRKEGSTCSYYSPSSAGELESEKDFEVECDGYLKRRSSNKHKNSRKRRDHKGFIDKQQECVKEQQKILEKKDAVKGYLGESTGASQDWRKKSEKKLNEDFSQHQSNVSVNLDKQNHEVDRVTDQSESRMKYKRLEDMSDKLNNSSQKQYVDTEKKIMISEVRKPQKVDMRATSSACGSRMKIWEENSTEVKDSREEKHQKTDHLIRITTGSREKSQEISQISDTPIIISENTLISHKHKLDPKSSSSEAKVTAAQQVAEVKTGTEYDHSSSEMKLVEGTTEGSSGHSSQGSGPKGPSDEMWNLTDASTQEPSETDAPDNISYSSENGDADKNSSRSVWMILGDVIRFRWASPRSESHSHTPNSCGGKGSLCLSVSSEAWFSSHDSNDDNLKKRSRKGLESPLPSSNNEGPFRTTSLPIIEESLIPLPAIRMRRSPSKMVDELVDPSHVSGSDSGIGELKSRKLVDNFDEWEEAYTLEAKKLKEDEIFMREALLEAKKAADVWEVPVGAVLVKGGKIIARGYNLVEELRDSTAHAEMICIRQASTNLSSWRLLDTTLYVTLEPCPMCAGAILQARIGTVVWGAPNKLLGADGSWIRLFSDGDGGKGSMPTDKPPAPVHPFHTNMAVRRGVLAAECARVMQEFFRLRRNKKPELESPIPPSSITVSHHHHHSNFFSKMQHAFKIIFCL